MAPQEVGCASGGSTSTVPRNARRTRADADRSSSSERSSGRVNGIPGPARAAADDHLRDAVAEHQRAYRTPDGGRRGRGHPERQRIAPLGGGIDRLGGDGHAGGQVAQRVTAHRRRRPPGRRVPRQARPRSPPGTRAGRRRTSGRPDRPRSDRSHPPGRCPRPAAARRAPRPPRYRCRCSDTPGRRVGPGTGREPHGGRPGVVLHEAGHVQHLATGARRAAGPGHPG